MTRKIIIIPILLVFLLAFIAAPIAFAATNNETSHQNQINQIQDDNHIIIENNQNIKDLGNNTNSTCSEKNICVINHEIHQENVSNNTSISHQTILIDQNHTNDSSNDSQNLTGVNLTQPQKSTMPDVNKTNHFLEKNTTHDPLNENFEGFNHDINEEPHTTHVIHEPPIGNGSDQVTGKGYKTPHIIDNDPHNPREEEEKSSNFKNSLENTTKSKEDDIL